MSASKTTGTASKAVSSSLRPTKPSPSSKILVDSVIYNKLSSAKNNFNVNRNIVISNGDNSFSITYEDFLEVGALLNEKASTTYLVQEHKVANPMYNTTAKPAIAVTFIHYDNNTMEFDVKETTPGHPFKKKSDTAKRYSLVLDASKLFLYYDVTLNDDVVSKQIESAKKSEKILELDDEF